MYFQVNACDTLSQRYKIIISFHLLNNLLITKLRITLTKVKKTVTIKFLPNELSIPTNGNIKKVDPKDIIKPARVFVNASIHDCFLLCIRTYLIGILTSQSSLNYASFD